LKIHQPISTASSLCFECDVFAKPGSKKESLVVSAEGSLVVKTHSRPIDGEANNAIVEMVAKYFGIAKSKIIIIRGDKSKNKRIKLLVEITANKDENFYIEKTTSILKD
jgi:uncharacterized protein YggU (UPF0235/DUF167 family)